MTVVPSDFTPDAPPSTVPPSTKVVRSLHVIYDADGTFTGELVYMAKKLLGIAHCAACDITHGPRREKPEFTELKVTAWTVPVENIHRDEMPDVMRARVGEQLPCVVARTDADDVVLVQPGELERCSGSIDAFQQAVDRAASRLGLVLEQKRSIGASCPMLFPSQMRASDSPFLGDAVVPNDSFR